MKTSWSKIIIIWYYCSIPWLWLRAPLMTPWGGFHRGSQSRWLIIIIDILIIIISNILINTIIKYLYQISLSLSTSVFAPPPLSPMQLVAEKVAGRSPLQQKSLHPLHYQDHHHHHHHDLYHHYHYQAQVKPEDVPLNLRGEGVTTHTMRLTWDQPIRSIIFWYRLSYCWWW